MIEATAEYRATASRQNAAPVEALALVLRSDGCSFAAALAHQRVL